jgi:hypothetical protein
VRWKEPRALAATDHTARRPHQGGARLRQRVRGQCGGGRVGLGSLIPHARAVRALMIAMIEPPFRAGPMAAPRRPHAFPSCRRPTAGGTIRLAAIAGAAEGERAVAAATGSLAKRSVHGVGAAARSDWTRRSNRGTTEKTGSVRRSIEAVIEGLEGSAPGPHLNPRPPISVAAIRSIGRGRSAASDTRPLDAHATAAKRLHGSPPRMGSPRRLTPGRLQGGRDQSSTARF